MMSHTNNFEMEISDISKESSLSQVTKNHTKLTIIKSFRVEIKILKQHDILYYYATNSLK